MLDLFLTILKFFFYGNMDWKGVAMVDTVNWYRQEHQKELRQAEEHRLFRDSLSRSETLEEKLERGCYY
jgi:hypothetical protein